MLFGVTDKGNEGTRWQGEGRRNQGGSDALICLRYVVTITRGWCIYV